MKNTKKLVAVLVALVMVVSCVFALVACDKHVCESKCETCGKCTNKDCQEDACKDKCEGHQAPAPEVPVTAGKVTLYLEAVFAEALPSYATIYYAGGATGWAKQGNALTNLEGTNIWYIQLALDSTVGQYNEYKVGLGYNATAGVGEDKQGMDAYAYVSTEAPSGLDNNKFEWDGTAQKVSLGTHHFDKQIPPAEKIKDVELRVTFKEALGPNADVIIGGAFNGWDWDTHATPDATRKVWSITLDEIIIADYQYLILVCPDTTWISEETKEEDAWGAMFDEAKIANYVSAFFPDGAPDGYKGTHAYFKIYNVLNKDVGGNLIYSAGRLDNENVVDLFMDKGVAEPLDILGFGNEHGPVAVEDTKWDEEQQKNVPAGTYTLLLDTSKPIEAAFTVTFTTALPTWQFVYLAGGMEGWHGTLMTASADRKTFTATVTVGVGSYEFKVVVAPSKMAEDSEKNIWDSVPGVKEVNSANATVTVSAAGEVELFEEAQVAPTLQEPIEPVEVTVTFTITFTEAVAANLNVYLAGNMEGWTGTLMTASADRKTFTVEKTLNTAYYEFKVIVTDGDFAWTGVAVFDNGSGGNAEVAVKAAGTVNLFESAKTMPAA